MKKLLTILCLVLLVSCSPPPEVPSNQLVERQGVTYQVNSEKPFTGTSVEYYLDTIIKNEFEERVLWKRTTYKDGVVDGLYESFHPNSQLKEKGNYNNGKEDGLQEKFFDNGQLQEKRTIENGKLVLHQTFDQEGNPLNDLIYKDGKKTGVEVRFYENGQLEERGNFKNGEMDGLWEFYQENGQLEFRSNYKDGKWDGFIEFFNEDGLFWFKNCYKNGEEINMSYCYKRFYEN